MAFYKTAAEQLYSGTVAAGGSAESSVADISSAIKVHVQVTITFDVSATGTLEAKVIAGLSSSEWDDEPLSTITFDPSAGTNQTKSVHLDVTAIKSLKLTFTNNDATYTATVTAKLVKAVI